MRPTATLLTVLLLVAAQAQWPTDPNDPLVICNEASYQKNLRLLGDGAGGWYVLWTDNRLATDRYAVFGQRLDAQGNLMWEPNGRLIQEVPGFSINFIGATRMSDNKLFLAYTSGIGQFTADTLRAMAFDGEGQPAWSEPILLAQPGPLPGGGTANGHFYPRVAQVQNGVFVGWGTNPIGAADYVHVARVLNDGTNLMPVQGVEVPSLNNSIVTGPWTFRHDLTGGLMLEERWGNGSGAPLFAMRVDSMGVERWPDLLQVSANSSGLGYEWSTAITATGRANSVWANGYDLRMAIYDTAGTLYNASAPIPVAIHPDVQENPFVVHREEETFVFWADNRATLGGGRQVFMQRFNPIAEPYLADNGVLAMQVNGNLNGFPRAILAENNSLIVSMFSGFNIGGGTAGLRVQRVTDDGTALWPDTVRFCVPSIGPNGGTEYGMASDGDGGAMAVWFNYETDAIYAARLDRNGRLGDFSSIDDQGHASFNLYPNPANDRITVELSDGSYLGELSILTADGRSVRDLGRIPYGRIGLDIRDLEAGLYVLRLAGPGAASVQRFVKH